MVSFFFHAHGNGVTVKTGNSVLYKMLPIRSRNDLDVVTNDVYRRNQQKSDVLRFVEYVTFCLRRLYEMQTRYI